MDGGGAWVEVGDMDAQPLVQPIEQRRASREVDSKDSNRIDDDSLEDTTDLVWPSSSTLQVDRHEEVQPERACCQEAEPSEYYSLTGVVGGVGAAGPGR